MIRLLQIAFAAAALFAFIMALLPVEHAPEHGDKMQHLFAFVVLAGLSRLAFPWLAVPSLFAAMLAFGALIEVAQLIPGLNRQADAADLFADLIGAAIGLAVASTAQWLATRARVQSGED
ncbi:MAG: teicoplanin resistance protein VanZ [Porphyrobacter sp.]|nr:teicoplanin resistance protein VanZ [Porphyrobacter sp.]